MNNLVKEKQVNTLEQCFNHSQNFLNKNYLSSLTNYQVVPVPQSIKDINLNDNIRLFKISKLVYDKNENYIDKLTNLYNAINNIEASSILLIDSNEEEVDLYIGAKIKDSKDMSASQVANILNKTFKGNFPGSEMTQIRKNKLEPLFENIGQSKIKNNDVSISCISGIPSLKNEDKDKFVQGLEKFINAMQGTVYTSIFIADSINQSEINLIKEGYEQLYTSLHPFLKSQLTYGENESVSIGQNISETFTKTLSDSMSKTQSFTEGNTITDGVNKSTSLSENEGTSYSDGYTESSGTNVGSSQSKGKTFTEGMSTSTSMNFGLNAGVGAGMALGPNVGGNIGISNTRGSSSSESDTYTDQISRGYNNSIGRNNSTSTSTGKSISNTEGESSSLSRSNNVTDSTTEQYGNSESVGNQKGSSNTQSNGTSKSLQVEYKNKSVENVLNQIEKQLERIDNSQSFGMWNCACYFIADDTHTSQVAASTFKSLMRGEDSFIENSHINTWDSNSPINLNNVKNYIKKLSHPLIDLGNDYRLNGTYVTPGSLISGSELAIQFNLPKKSVSGLPVMEMAEFGRNVTTYDGDFSEKINLGNIFHMGQEENKKVEINLESLGMHTFITGSTGSGKSNTVYKLLNEANKKGIKFLVIEPAKGEYKEVFGGRNDVNVFGSNPKFSEVLRVNPFRFNDDVHILEHIDRLIEIFNASWPMYSAMPAILKDAVEKSYEKFNWDLEFSICYDEKVKYPSFNDLLESLEKVINNSSYSDELKSNYKGALCTRVKSLTNGLYGRIFAQDEIDEKTLFDENTIVDLSRIGSSETKSLITGILFIKLQEYRMTSREGCNQKLKHLTVLEEAHNLLRKTSSEQSQEGSNLQGKSVEMISNAIAEMRTYGEGFIISDQAPNLLDDSAIRNTNTKIILRLPQMQDRESVGKSASLNEDQINEIPKLKTGVAVVYQNNWMEPILCKIDRFDDERPLEYNFNGYQTFENEKKLKGDLVKILLSKRVEKGIDLSDIDIDLLIEYAKTMRLTSSIRNYIVNELNNFKEGRYLEIWNDEQFDNLSSLIYIILDGERIIEKSSKKSDMNSWNETTYREIFDSIDINHINDDELKKYIVQNLLHHQSFIEKDFEGFYCYWIEQNIVMENLERL
ncbi:MAG: DUF87 domain-containing protein [Peptostreptococcaceae bacterium]